MSKKKITVLKLMQSIVAMLLRYLLTKEHHRFRSCSIIPSIIQGKRQLAKRAPRQGAQESAEATTGVYVPLVTEPRCHHPTCTIRGLDTS